MAATIETIQVNSHNITVITEKDNRLPLINMQLVFQNSGSIQDGDKPGLARLSAKLLNEGTKTKGSSKFAQELEGKAINISSYAGNETFVIEISCFKEQFLDALKYLKELLENPN